MLLLVPIILHIVVAAHTLVILDFARHHDVIGEFVLRGRVAVSYIVLREVLELRVVVDVLKRQLRLREVVLGVHVRI